MRCASQGLATDNSLVSVIDINNGSIAMFADDGDTASLNTVPNLRGAIMFAHLPASVDIPRGDVRENIILDCYLRGTIIGGFWLNDDFLIGFTLPDQIDNY